METTQKRPVAKKHLSLTRDECLAIFLGLTEERRRLCRVANVNDYGRGRDDWERDRDATQSALSRINGLMSRFDAEADQ